jgi:hypothetical protein
MRKADARENLYTRLSLQTCLGKITSACVPLMVVCLSANWTSASCREFVYSIVQAMVVFKGMGGIDSHENYEELRAANQLSRGTLLQMMQETCNRGAEAFRDKTRELVMPVLYFEDTTVKSALFSVTSKLCLAWQQTIVCFLMITQLHGHWSRYVRLR